MHVKHLKYHKIYLENPVGIQPRETIWFPRTHTHNKHQPEIWKSSFLMTLLFIDSCNSGYDAEVMRRVRSDLESTNTF